MLVRQAYDGSLPHTALNYDQGPYHSYNLCIETLLSLTESGNVHQKNTSQCFLYNFGLSQWHTGPTSQSFAIQQCHTLETVLYPALLPSRTASATVSSSSLCPYLLVRIQYSLSSNHANQNSSVPVLGHEVLLNHHPHQTKIFPQIQEWRCYKMLTKGYQT
jgi:hypothetical protein